MTVREMLDSGYSYYMDHGPINIVALGDSVTFGAFEDHAHDFDAVYWNQLHQMLKAYGSCVTVNMLQAGFGGITAGWALKNLDRHVLCHHPDLVIVCYGLNDVNWPLETFVDSLGAIFDRCLEAGSQVIYMTPNMMNTVVPEGVPPTYYGLKTARYQNEGRVDEFMDAARQVAKERNIPVCDCYAIWKEMSKTQDINLLLANNCNHPIREMHTLFARELYKVIMGEEAPRMIAEQPSDGVDPTLFSADRT